jgi:hypothetical protein
LITTLGTRLKVGLPISSIHESDVVGTRAFSDIDNLCDR